VHKSSVLIVTVLISVLGTVAAQRPLAPPNYYLFELPELLPGETLTGQLTTSDGQNFKDGSYVDLYTFAGLAGDRIDVRVSSSDFDPYVTLFDPQGVPVAMNDDLAGSADAGIDFTLSDDGRHLVVVSGYSRLDLGHYSVSLQMPDSQGWDARPLALPVAISSQLSPAMPSLFGSGLGATEYFWLDVQEAVLIVADVHSAEFDTVLTLYNTNLDQLAQNDDTSSTSDSQLVMRVRAGRYLLAVSSYFSDSFGSYDLNVETYVPSE